MDLTEERQFVVTSTRPIAAGSNSVILNRPELITVMNLDKFGDEQKHWIAHVRLGADGAVAYEGFVKQLRERDAVSGDADGSEQSGDVFGNPMMLSMLLCYLQTCLQSDDNE